MGRERLKRMDKVVLEGRWVWSPKEGWLHYMVNDHYVYGVRSSTKFGVVDGPSAYWAYHMADTLAQQLDPLGRITIKHPTELPVFSEVVE